MKKIFTVLAAILLTASLFAQAPEKMSYQAVIRNSSDALVTNTQVGMQISILLGSPGGTVIYTEIQTPLTNANGLVSIEIGGGAGFSSIDWSNGTYFIKTETDPAGGTNYTITGVSQLLSVPYALYAKTAGSIIGTITETDPIFGASPAGGINSTDINNWNNKLDTEVDGSITNEIQILSISHDTVFLSNGGFVKLPAGFDGQYSSLTGTPTNVSIFTNDAGYLTTEVDGSVTNEIQVLSISHDTVFLSNGGFAKLPSGFDGQYSSLTGVPTNVSAFTNDVGYLTSYSETDQLWTASPSFGIANTDITNWTTSYGWGNHASAGYLTSYTELDTMIWKRNSSNIFFNSGNVGIGTNSPSNALTVIGSANFSTSVFSPALIPLIGDGTVLTISTNSVSTNTNVGDMIIKGGNNNGPSNSSGRAGDISITGGTFNVPFPTNPATSRAGNVNISGGASPTGSGIVGVGGNVTLTGGSVGPSGTNGNGGAITLVAGSGNQGGNINITAGTGAGPGKVYIQGGTSTLVSQPGHVIISGGDKTGGIYGSVIFKTATTQQAVIDATGNVGIGTATPAFKLDVNGDVNVSGTYRVNGTALATVSTTGSYSDLINQPTTVSSFTNDAGYLNSFTEIDPKVGANTSGYSPKWDGTALVTGAIYQNVAGNVGIGTSIADAKLQIKPSAEAGYTLRLLNYSYDDRYISIWRGTDGGVIDVVGPAVNPPVHLAFYIGGSEKVRITDAGNVGIGTSIPNASAELDVTSTTKGFLPPRMTTVQMATISGPAEGLMIYNTDYKLPFFFDGTDWRKIDGTIVLYVGKSYQGGIIAYILQVGDPGYIAGETHGIIAAPSDQSSSAQWGCYGATISGADGTAIGTGAQNTIDIENGCTTPGTAADICANLVLGGYSDWYLPSKDELYKLYLNRVVVGGFASVLAWYWSSSENSSFNAWFFHFSSVFTFYDSKGLSGYVRAVRAF